MTHKNGRPVRAMARINMSRRAFVGASGASVLATTGGYPPVRTPATAQAQATPAPASPVASPAGPAAGVRVFPAHGARTASPATEISLRGTRADAIRPVLIKGSQSGLHSGLLAPHGDGGGLSFLPDAPFTPGETVTVHANQPIGPASDGSLTFTVARPAPSAPPREIDRSRNPEATFQAFRSRPDLKPPKIDVTTVANGTGPGLIILGAKVSNGIGGPMILDNQGEVVWYAPTEESRFANDVRVQQWRGDPVLTWWEGATPRGYGIGHYVIADTSYRRVAEFQAGNGYNGGDVHDFLITPRDTALVTIYNPVYWDLRSIGGARNASTLDGIVQEIEIATGRVLFEWHSLDHVDVAESMTGPPSSPQEQYDYFHLNSIAQDGDDAFIICARRTDAIYKVDGRTGEIVWRLNGKRSDFDVEKRAVFALQHDARPLPGDQISLFDNASEDAKAGIPSRGLILQLDLAAMTATMVREYEHETGIVASSQGNLQTLPNGNVFIGWGNAPVFSEFSADGTMCFNGRFPTGANSYRSYRHPWSARPDTAPDVVAEQSDNGTTAVFVSWNGATEVAGWRILSGAAPDQLRPVIDAPRRGFETSITVKTTDPYVAAIALDRDGRDLAVSKAISAAPRTPRA